MPANAKKGQRQESWGFDRRLGEGKARIANLEVYTSIVQLKVRTLSFNAAGPAGV